jgi:hypothetical protein
MMVYLSSARSVALLARRAIIVTTQYLPTFGLTAILIGTISTLYLRTAYPNDIMATKAINTSYYMVEVTQILHTSYIYEVSLTRLYSFGVRQYHYSHISHTSLASFSST